MSKYIDADKAKNGIMKFVNEYGEIVGMFVNDFNILLERSAADVEPRWIPVSEKLPEEYGKYNTTVESDLLGNYVRELYYGTSYCFDGVQFYCPDAEYGDVPYRDSVIAWMPLPSPYKEGEQR